jgi:hypothetical protein
MATRRRWVVQIQGMTRLQLARLLLSGSSELDKHKRRRSIYLKPGSPEELVARRTLAALLRSDGPLDRQIRDVLANLVDPDPQPWEPRTIRLEYRAEGTPADHIANTQLAEYVLRLIRKGATVTEACDGAADRFKVNESTVMKVWSNYRPVLEQIYGPLPRRRKRRS